MDQIVAQALTLYGKIEGMKRKEALKLQTPAPSIIYTNGNGKRNLVENLETVS
jgi:hypothetical protein